MPNPTRLIFTGDSSITPANPHEDAPKYPEPYIVSEALKKAVNLAIYLHRPLLLEGDAGCGKTRLAAAVAYELGLPLYRWDIRSTTKARDGLYEYDAILRLHDVQTKTVAGAEKLRNPAEPKDYRQFGALGKAFLSKNTPAVVLIDEIDKAELDFPNDLLGVLDEPWQFSIKETGETIQATYPNPDCRPIVIITSNKEKGNLPAPFLRRCLYHYLEFPKNPQLLQEIINKHYQLAGETLPPTTLVNNAVERFLDLWEKGGLFKKPGTSELLDWLKALHTFADKPYSATQLKKDSQLPYPELIFKLQQDWRNKVL
jgi:MoxR-like ATPase